MLDIFFLDTKQAAKPKQNLQQTRTYFTLSDLSLYSTAYSVTQKAGTL